jgi:hypothetical protein
MLAAGELADLPGAVTIPEGSVTPGVNEKVFVFARVSIQQNLYRIHLPE